MFVATIDMMEPSSQVAPNAAWRADIEVVRAARQGDRAAFARLNHQYAPLVNGIALARVPWPDSLDLVQEVFVEALRNVPTLRDVEAFGPWLAAIARNLATDFHRSRRRSEPVDGHEPTREAPAAAEQPKAEAMRILNAIRSLPSAYSETLTLRLVEGLSGPQI